MNATLLALLNLNFPGWQSNPIIWNSSAVDKFLAMHVKRMGISYSYALRQLLKFVGEKDPYYTTIT